VTSSSVNYGIIVETELEFDDAVETVIEELEKEGFGILSRIDVQATLKMKLNVDHPKHIILGASFPELAFNVLRAEPWAGLLFPCNVVVQELDGVTQIGFMDPEVLQRETANPAVSYTVSDARERFIRVANSLAGQLSATSPV